MACSRRRARRARSSSVSPARSSARSSRRSCATSSTTWAWIPGPARRMSWKASCAARRRATRLSSRASACAWIDTAMTQPHDYVISVRRVDPRGRFEPEPGDETLFLKVPAAQAEYTPAHKVSFERWRSEVNEIALRDEESPVGSKGDLLIFVHGYNNKRSEILTRTRLLRETLGAEKWDGAVVAFDWPCDRSTLNYLEDRADARDTALRLVRDCILKLGAIQDPEDRKLWERAGLAESARRRARPCELNIHLIGHSTGAYVIMEAFAQAQSEGDLHRSAWRIGQVAFIGGDVSSDSMSAGSDWA